LHARACSLSLSHTHTHTLTQAPLAPRTLALAQIKLEVGPGQDCMRSARFPDLARSFSLLFEHVGHDDMAASSHDMHKAGGVVVGGGGSSQVIDAEPEDEFDWDAIM
jgi:hypothetical protein